MMPLLLQFIPVPLLVWPFGLKAGLSFILFFVIVLDWLFLTYRKEKQISNLRILFDKPLFYLTTLLPLFLFITFALYYNPFVIADFYSLASSSENSLLVKGTLKTENPKIISSGVDIRLNIIESSKGVTVSSENLKTDSSGRFEAELDVNTIKNVNSAYRIEVSSKYIFGQWHTEIYNNVRPFRLWFASPGRDSAFQEGTALTISGAYLDYFKLPPGSGLWVLSSDLKENFSVYSSPLILDKQGGWLLDGLGVELETAYLKILWVDAASFSSLRSRLFTNGWSKLPNVPPGAFILDSLPVIVTPGASADKQPELPQPGAPPAAAPPPKPSPSGTGTPSSTDTVPPTGLTDINILWELARYYGYDNPNGKYSPVLNEADITYWAGRALPESRIRREFQSRGQIIFLSEEHGYIIPTKEELTGWAEKLLAGESYFRIETTFASEGTL